MVSPLNDRAQPEQASGAPPPVLPSSPNSAGPRSRSQRVVPGGGLPFLSETELGAVRNIPGYAEAMIRRAKTGGKRDMSGLGGYRENMLGTALKSLLAMIMPNSDRSYVGGPMEQANDLIAQLVSGATSGQGFGGVLRNQAANLMGQDFSGLKDDQIYPMLAAAQSAAGFGYGPFAQFGPENALEELENTYLQSALAGGTQNVLGQPGALNAFQQLLQQYLGTR